MTKPLCKRPLLRRWKSTGLTLQTGENVATGDQTLKISMPGTETVTTEQVENLLDSLNENYPDNQFAELSLSNVSAAMGTKSCRESGSCGVCTGAHSAVYRPALRRTSAV